MTIIASTELILIQTKCSGKLRMNSIHSGKHIMDRILLIRRVMLGAPSMWEIICKWSALWCCRVINKSSYQNEKWNFKNEEVSINLGHWCMSVFSLPFAIRSLCDCMVWWVRGYYWRLKELLTAFDEIASQSRYSESDLDTSADAKKRANREERKLLKKQKLEEMHVEEV